MADFGYARVSTSDQHLTPQIDALVAAGCVPDKIFKEVASGAKAERKELAAILNYLRPGDNLVVCRLDRLGRSLKHLIEVANELQQRGIGLKSLQESIDTTTAGGRLIFHVFGALAEFERELIRERTNAGLSSARARGRKGGRRKALSIKNIEAGKALAADKTRSISDICTMLKCSKTTYYRYVHSQLK